MEMKDEVTFLLILCSYKCIKTMQISLGREIYKAVGRIIYLFCQLLGTFGFYFSADAAAMAGFTPSRVDFSSSSSVFSLLITHSRASRPCQENTEI